MKNKLHRIALLREVAQSSIKTLSPKNTKSPLRLPIEEFTFDNVLNRLEEQWKHWQEGMVKWDDTILEDLTDKEKEYVNHAFEVYKFERNLNQY